MEGHKFALLLPFLSGDWVSGSLCRGGLCLYLLLSPSRELIAGLAYKRILMQNSFVRPQDARVEHDVVCPTSVVGSDMDARFVVAPVRYSSSRA